MTEYKGTAADGSRSKSLGHIRDETHRQFELKKESIKAANQIRLGDMSDSFQSKQSGADEAFKASTVGLVSAEDFKRKRIDIEKADIFLFE
jgi:hypothetical protein